MPFFIRKKQGKSSQRPNNKRKKDAGSDKFAKKTKKEKLTNGKNEVISSEEDDILSDAGGRRDDENSLSEDETEQEKKLRLTKKYLEELEKQESEKVDLEDDTREAVAKRLKEEALEEEGRLYKKVAHEYESLEPEILCTLRGHKLSITCLVISSCEKFIWSGSKDCSIIKWSVANGKKVKTIPGRKKGIENHIGHTSHILSLALSHDDKFLASGCQKGIVNAWNPDTMDHIKTFRGHKGAISALVFQRGSHQLISASSDRSLKLWNLDEMGYVETLFGHQDGITGIDSFIGETAVTSGGRDNTVRMWKIVEESQLVFQGHGASIDCVCVTGPKKFVSGADDGSLSFWGSHKKKPLSKLLEVHGCDPVTGSPHWITSVCSLQNSDLLSSGSQNGEIKLYRCDDENNTLHQVSTIPAVGFVNALRFSLSGNFLVAGLGQEHKLGRWWRIKEARNVIVVYSWPKNR